MNFSDLLKDALEETGLELDASALEAKQIMAEEAAKLLLVADEPGFNLVLRASRDNVALRLGIVSSLQASAADQRILGIIQTGLLMVL